MLAERWQTLAAAAAAADEAAADADRTAVADRQPTAALIRSLGALRFCGPDVLNFLQGYLTADLDRLTGQAPLFTALTNLKGRVVATGWCRLSATNQLDWIIHADLVPLVAEFMSRYLAFSKTRLIEIDADCISVGLIDNQGNPSARLISSAAELDQLLTTHHIVPAAGWATACIEHGILVVDRNASESYLPQMIGLVEAGAVDFDKGCYLGQEVVARAQHRGEVKRRLLRLTGADAGVQAGDPLRDQDGKDAGNVLACEPPLCLAVVRQPAGTHYQAGTQRLTAEAS